ncbi:hypothetical protein FEP07_01342 [Burkholderia multivorans]|nr:hypothetical protein [Burkholderia multivorans]MDR9268508.1 hypothetical protein [Burkholderia multivorans]MDR9284078.1 hypothetical protein [Burkholderia multivorans]MDR9292231.1 hypothetical protein [Burkholderia multivorans]MDR9314479.1 hypothetical protein [Burkholderia multivorans]
MLRRMGRLTLTIEIHSDWSRSGADLSTWIDGASMMIRRHSPLGFLRFDRPRDARLDNEIRASANRLCGAHHRNSQRSESLRGRPIHMDRRCFDDDSPALTAQAHGDSTVHTTRISATKSAPRRIVGLALTIEIHSDWSRSEADLSTWIDGASMMTRRHSPFRLTAIRWSTRCASWQQNPRFSESSALHSSLKFTAIGVAPGLTYPHR